MFVRSLPMCVRYSMCALCVVFVSIYEYVREGSVCITAPLHRPHLSVDTHVCNL